MEDFITGIFSGSAPCDIPYADTVLGTKNEHKSSQLRKKVCSFLSGVQCLKCLLDEAGHKVIVWLTGLPLI